MGLRPGLVWIISLILCTPSVPSSTGMWERVWRRESSPRPVRISLPWRRITRRSELTPSREKERRRERNIKVNKQTNKYVNNNSKQQQVNKHVNNITEGEKHVINY